MYIQNIFNFEDFVNLLRRNERFLWCDNHIVADFYLSYPLCKRYNFYKCLEVVEQTISARQFMFDFEPCDKFIDADGNYKQGYIVTLKGEFL